MSPAILCDDLQKRFGDVIAVAGLSFTVAAGEIYGLLGPNGAGKTTTMRVLAGLLLPTAGVVTVDGVNVSADPDRAKQKLGFLSGGAGLYARLRPREILTYTGRVYGMSHDAISARTTALTEQLDMASFLDRRAETLSTGQKQRVSLARAVFHDPPVLILDEPTSGLDVFASLGLRAFVMAERQRGKGIVISTHYLAEAELICDRVGFVHQGRIVEEGTPTQLRAATGASSLEQAFLAVVTRKPAAPETV
ncbi:MAG: ABC transporter ATP-binding protein [Deltaproteobacteria bacterium]|nr:ABC transporter ATP-binding protein [Deltaproteobacteria bacterium]